MNPKRIAERTNQLNCDAQAGLPTAGDVGKNENTKATSKKASVISLSGAPHFPSDHLRGRSASPRRRFRRTQPTEMM